MDKYKKKSRNKRKNKIIAHSEEELFDISEKITDNSQSINYILEKDKRMQKPESQYLSQFGLQTFDSEGLPGAINDLYQSNDKTKLADLERELSYQEGWSQYKPESMSYGIYSDDQLTHDNMAPFYKLKNGYGTNDLYNESVKNYKNELFTGNLKDSWKKKQEVSPLFSPVANSSFIYGTPNRTEEEKERIVPSRYRQNEKLFEEKWVTPGVNLQPDEKGTHGYQSMYRVQYKTVDELRGCAKPKITYEGRVIEGQRGQARPIQAPVISYRPDSYKISTHDDLLPTGGVIDAPQTRNNYIMKDTDRAKQHFEYTGGAYSNHEAIGRNIPEHLREKYKHSQKQSFKLPKPLQKYGKDEVKYNPNLSSYHLPLTTRDQTVHNDYIGIADGDGSIYANLMDSARTTIKETTISPHVPSQIAPNTMRGTVQPMDIAKSTIKETTVENQLNPHAISLNTVQRVYHCDVAKTTNKETMLEPVVPMNTNQQNNMYTNWMDIAKQTTKETTVQIPYQTIMTPINQQQRAPNPQDIARTTMKESTSQIPYQTIMTPINQQQRAPNPQDIARTTMKESTSQIPYQTIVTPINQHQRAANPQDIARTTIRESTVQIPYQTMVTPINQHQTPATMQDIAKSTMKEITVQTPWNNFVTPVNQQQRAADPQDIAKSTMKEITVQTPWNNFVTPINQQQRAANPQDIAKTTIKETTVQIPYQTSITPVGQWQRAPDLQDVARTTVKETTVTIPYHTNIQNGNQNQGKANTFSRIPLKTTSKEQTVVIPYQTSVTAVNQQQRAPNPQDVAKTTLKEQTVQIPYNTHAIAVGQQQRAPDPQDLLKTTIKEQTVQIPYNTHTTAINQAMGKVNTFNKIPLKTTVKETTIDNEHIGMAVKDINGKGYGYLAEKMDAPNTNRQFTGQEVYIAPIIGNAKSRPYNDAYNAEINDKREQLQIYRAPTNSNVNIGPDPKNITLHVTEDDNRMPGPMVGYTVNNQLDRLRNKTYFKPTEMVPSDRYLDNMVLKQLENNPYHISYFGIQ